MLGGCKGIVEGLRGSPLFGSGGGSACCHVGCGAFIVPPADPSGVDSALGFEGVSAHLFYGVVKVLEGSVKVRCGYRQSVWGVMI